MFGYVALIVIVGLLAYIRLAPTDVARWHTPVEASENKDLAGGAIRIIDGGADRFAALRQIAEDTPRTEIIAGDASSGLMTFRTRSKWMGFPDYTTAELSGDQIKLFARLRFGRSDLGVNKTRLERWIRELERR